MKSPGNDTIAAVATGAGGGIGIVRISGPDALPIAARIFRGREVARSKPLLRFSSFSARPATLIPPEPIDEVLAVHMPEGRSYTGEPTVEIQGHGGRVVSKPSCRRRSEPEHGTPGPASLPSAPFSPAVSISPRPKRGRTDQRRRR